MSARHLVIGLDGADLDLIRSFGSDALPELHGIMQRGAFAALESVQPPATLPNWTTFLTGVDPGAHGVFDFTTRRGYRVRFTAGTVREAPTIAERLDRLGKRCALLFFPATYPPPELSHGIAISGWDSPVAFEADDSYVSPRALYDAIEHRFGRPRFDDIDELAADQPGWHEDLAERLCARIEKKTEHAEWLIDGDAWDFFAFYFGESDTASHYLFGLHDPSSPRHPAGTTRRARRGLEQVYRSLDRAVGRLIERAGTSAEITILSDHGSGGSSDKVLYLNRVLADGGFLAFHPPRLSLAPVIKELALTRLSPAMRERIFRWVSLPSWLESRTRFGQIDMKHTVAFSDELNYFPAIHFNLAGREPGGILAASDVTSVRRELESYLKKLRDPWSGRPVIKHVYHRDELFEGPFVHRAPDLLLEFHLDCGYSFNLAPSASAPPNSGAWRRLEPEEYLGRKARSLPGSHRSHGFLAMMGPRVAPTGQIDAHIADVTATVLSRMQIAPPSEFSGRALFEVLRESSEPWTSLAAVDQVRARTATESETFIEHRLRALGYIE